MDDLQIHSFTKRTARDAGDFRTASRTIERNFERQLLRATYTKSEERTAQRCNDENLQANRDATPKSKDRIDGCRTEKEPDAIDEVSNVSASPFQSTEVEVKSRDAEVQVEAPEEAAEIQTAIKIESASVTEEQFAKTEAEVTSSEAAEIPANANHNVANLSATANTVPEIEEVSNGEEVTSALQEDTPSSSAPVNVGNEDSGEGQSTNSEVTVEETKSGETLASNSNRSSLEESTSDVESQAVHQVDAKEGIVAVAGAEAGTKQARSVNPRETEKIESKRGHVDKESVTAAVGEGHILVQKLTDSALADAVIKIEEQSEAQPLVSEQSSNEPKLEVKGDSTNFLQRLVSGRTAIGPRSESQEAGGEPRVDVARFVGRVAGAFRTANERGGVLQLRLSPPELGSMKLELIVERGALTARIEAETTTARKVLLDNLPALRDRLAQQEIRIERFDVDVRRDGTGGQPDWQAGDRQERQFQNAPRQGLRLAPARVEVALESERPQRDIVDGRLNVIA